MLYEVSSSQARKNFYQILKRVGERGDNFVIKIYRDAKVRIIREDLAQILEEIIGKNIWAEIHKILEKNGKVGESTKETIKKILRPKLSNTSV